MDIKEHLVWCSNALKDEQAQKVLEEKVGLLIETHFKDSSDYAIEKFVKSFSETIIYLENLMLTNRGIHPSQISKSKDLVRLQKDDILQKYKEVRKIIIGEIKRQFRHYNTFLS